MNPAVRQKSPPAPAPNLRHALLETATRLFRRQGFIAATVDEICAQSGATKGAFFHHFSSKEALAEECLARWRQGMAASIAASPGVDAADPVDRALALLDFFVGRFSDPKQLKSCLAGTTAQEVSETHPRLRDAANDCFVALQRHLQTLLDDACRSRRLKRDTAALATLWIATLQGALVLSKASRDDSVVADSLRHVRAYIASQLADKPPAARRTAKR